MRKPHKIALIGVLTIGTVALSNVLFSSLGLMFGTEQIVLTSAAGVLGSVKLLAGA